VIRRLTRRLAEAAGWQVLERRFYSPVPDLPSLPDDAFERRSPLAGLELDLDAQADLARQLGSYMREFGAGPAGYEPRNGYYETGDAEIAYAMVRHLRPERIVEFGSGYSTLVLSHAAERNRAAGVDTRLQTFDPFPSPVAAAGALEEDELTEQPAQEVPLEITGALGAGDLLFVDTSHTVKLGGDVNHIVLELLPRLAPGVWAHFHDIWLPAEYHPTLVREMEMYWAEQYLLQAFLAFNERFEIAFATRALADHAPELLPELIPGLESSLWPSSFWIRRRA
jgi:Methyltransferase domain